jgi:hypothetical protein
MTEVDSYWHRKVTANPTLADKNSRVTMKSSALEKEIRKAFEEGKRVGTRQGIQLGKFAKFSDAEQNVLDDLFKQTGDK